jgi:hypothetical protein
LAALGALQSGAHAQIADQLVMYGHGPPTGNNVLRFDRRLHLLGETAVPSVQSGSIAQGAPIAIDGSGRLWVAYSPLGPTTLVRMTPGGELLASAELAHNPVSIMAQKDGHIAVLTRIPLVPPGPAYSVAPDASVVWSNNQGPSLYTLAYADNLAVTTNGEWWMGEPTPPPGKFWAQTLLTRLRPHNGNVMATYQPPDLTGGTGDEVLAQLVAVPDGTMWMFRGGPADGAAWGLLENTDGKSILQTIPLFSAGTTGLTAAMRADGAGNLYVVSGNDIGGDQLYRFNPASPDGPEASYAMGGLIAGHALGANGDEAYVVIALPTVPISRRLERVNLVTGRKSSRGLEAWSGLAIPYGDPTGHTYANIIDRQGDNDGDGVPNGVETAARSNPFDPLSRPDGPKIHIDFTANNAIILFLSDPDGIVDPEGGLDLTALTVQLGPHGNVFNILLPFITFVQVSPDLTQATAVFGALPLASNLKWELEARVADKTGAVGWDWQVTPPGNL